MALGVVGALAGPGVELLRPTDYECTASRALPPTGDVKLAEEYAGENPAKSRESVAAR